LTSQPAPLFGIGRRGALKAGWHADLLLFDPATFGRGPKRRVFDLPAGAPRLTTPALGVHGVWVNGVRVAGAEGPRRGEAPPGPAGLRGRRLRARASRFPPAAVGTELAVHTVMQVR